MIRTQKTKPRLHPSVTSHVQPGRPSVEELATRYADLVQFVPYKTGRPAQPVESDTQWWPSSQACAAALDVHRETMRGYIRAGATVKGHTLRYSRCLTRSAWSSRRPSPPRAPRTPQPETREERVA